MIQVAIQCAIGRDAGPIHEPRYKFRCECDNEALRMFQSRWLIYYLLSNSQTWSVSGYSDDNAYISYHTQLGDAIQNAVPHTDVSDALCYRSPMERQQFLCVQTHFEYVIQQSENGSEWEGCHEYCYESILQHCSRRICSFSHMHMELTRIFPYLTHFQIFREKATWSPFDQFQITQPALAIFPYCRRSIALPYLDIGNEICKYIIMQQTTCTEIGIVFTLLSQDTLILMYFVEKGNSKATRSSSTN